MAKKKKQNTYGAIGAIAGLARAGKDAGTVRNKKAPKKERQKAQKRLKAYSSGNKSVYVPKQARTTNRQAKLQTIQKAQQKTAPKSITEKKPELSAYQKYQKALKQQEKVKAAQSVNKAKLPLSNKAYKEQKNQARKEVKRVQSNYTLTGLKKNTEQAGISTKKAQERAKKEKPTQISNNTALKEQYLSRIPKALRDKGVGDNLLTAKEKKQIQTNIQADYDRGSIGTGFMSSSMPVAKLKEATESAYGIKLDDSKGKEKLGYKIGEAAGYLAKSTLFGGAGEAAVGKALTKVIATKTGKQVTSKAAKFGINRASEAIASAPVNVEDAAKNSKNAKEFVQNLTVNAALDAGLGSTVDVVKAAGRAAKTAKAKTIHSAIQKTLKGQNLTESEASALAKVKKRAEKKRENGKPLNTAERLANKAAVRGQALEQSAKQTKATALERNTTIKASNPVTKIKDAAQGRKADKAFSQQVDKVLTGELKPSEELIVGKTPRKLQEHGASDIDMTMKQSTVKKTAYPAGYMDALKGVRTRNTQGHNLGIGTVKQIRKDLENPVAILKSDTQKESFVVFTRRVDQEGNPIMVALHLDKNGKIGVSNEVASAYGKDNYMNFITAQREKGNVLYENKKTGLDSLPGSGLQLPELGDKSDPINTLYQNGGKVNKKEAPQLLNMPKDLQPTSKTPDVSASTTSIPDPQAKHNPESPKIGDTVDDVTIERVGKQESPVSVDLDHDPEVRKILSKGSAKPDSGSTLKEKIVNAKDIFRQKTVDSLQGIEKMGRKMKGEAGEALIAQASALRRCSEIANYCIFHKQTDFNRKIVGEGLFEILGPVMKQGDRAYEDFNAYLFHQLNLDRYQNDKALWLDVPPEKSEAVIQTLSEAHPDFIESAEKIWQYCRNQNDIRVQSGLITQGKQDLLQSIYQHYVPAYRNMDMKAVEAAGKEMRINTGIRTAKGGDQEILPIHEQLINATQQTWRSAEMNETINMIARAQGLEKSNIAKEIVEHADSEEALEDMLNRTSFFEVDGNSVKVTYYERGELRETHINKLIYDGLKQWTAEEKHIMLDTGAFDKLLTGLEDAAKGFNRTGAGKALIGFNNLFKGLITSYNPFFLIRNGLKDIQDVPVNSSNLTGFAASMPKAFKSMSARDEWWQTYLAAGSRYSGIIDPEAALKPKSKAAKVVTAPLSLLEKANMAVESYPRYTEFLNILRQQGVKDIKQATRAQIEKAAKGAADITCDFGRTGSLTSPLNRSAVPFLNASIQGADKLWRVLSGQKGFRGYVALGAKLAALGAAPAVAQEIIYSNDPDYQQLNARDRAGNYFIKNADGTFWKIPRGRTISTLTNPMQQAARAFAGNDKMSFDEFTQKLITDIAPVNPSDSFILKQMINTYTNQTWYGGTIEGYSDQYKDDGTPKPKIERYDTRTSKIAKKLSEVSYSILKDALGEEAAEKYTMSPMKWDYLIDSYGGIAADIALSSTRIGKTKTWWQETFDTNFKKDPVYSNHLSSRYYEQQTSIKEAAAKKDATPQEKAMAKMLTTTNVNLSSLKSLQDTIRYDNSMSIKEKAAVDRELQKAVNDLYRGGVSKEAMKAFNDFVAKNKDTYMSADKLAYAAAAAHERVTHSTVRTMDILYQHGGMKAVLHGRSSYMHDGEKVIQKFSNDKTIGKLYKGYRKNGGKDKDFYKLYREMTKQNKEHGTGTDAQYGNLAAVLIHSDKELGSKKQLKKAFGVTEKHEELVKEYFSYKGTRKEALRAMSLADSGSNSLRDKQKDGTYKDYNHDAPFKSRAIAEGNLYDCQ